MHQFKKKLFSLFDSSPTVRLTTFIFHQAKHGEDFFLRKGQIPNSLNTLTCYQWVSIDYLRSVQGLVALEVTRDWKRLPLVISLLFASEISSMPSEMSKENSQTLGSYPKWDPNWQKVASPIPKDSWHPSFWAHSLQPQSKEHRIATGWCYIICEVTQTRGADWKQQPKSSSTQRSHWADRQNVPANKFMRL